MLSHHLQLISYRKKNPSYVFWTPCALKNIYARQAPWADQESQVAWPEPWPQTPVKGGILLPDVQCESACLVLLQTNRRGSSKGRVSKKQDVTLMTLGILQTEIQDKARNMSNQTWLLKGMETEAKWVICFPKNTQNMPVREHKLSKWLCNWQPAHKNHQQMTFR